MDAIGAVDNQRALRLALSGDDHDCLTMARMLDFGNDPLSQGVRSKGAALMPDLLTLMTPVDPTVNHI